MPVFQPEDRDQLIHWLQTREVKPFTIDSMPSSNIEANVLSMQKLNAIVKYEPNEMIVTVEAGITLQELDAVLRKSNQWLPTLQPLERRETTLGAALANGYAHPRERTHSPLRATVLGGLFATMDGTLFKSGSRVVKSVAGYDIHRAFVGSKGAFGVIVEVNLKVAPLPERIIRFRIGTDHQERIIAFNPSVLIASKNECVVELAGYAEDIEVQLSELGKYTEIGEKDWIALIHQQIYTNPPSLGEHPLLQDLRKVFDPGQVLSNG